MAKKLKRLSKSSFLESASELLGVARELLQRDGFLDLMVVWVTEDRDLFVTASYNPPLMEVERLRKQGRDDEADDLKNGIWNAVREQLKEQKAIGYFTVSEAWVSTKPYSKGDVAFGEEPGRALFPGMTPPRQDPKRREAIMINWEWKGPPEGVYSAGYIAQFYRREGNKIVLEEIDRLNSPIGGAQEGLLR